MSKESQCYGSDRSFDPETNRYSRRYRDRESPPVPELVSKYGDFENDTEGFMARMSQKRDEKKNFHPSMYSDLPAEQVDAMFAAFNRMPSNLQKQMGGSIPLRVVPEPVSPAKFYGVGATLITPAKTGGGGGVPSSPAKTGGDGSVLVFSGKAGGDAVPVLLVKRGDQDTPQDIPVKIVESTPEKAGIHPALEKVRETEDVVAQLLEENARLNEEVKKLKGYVKSNVVDRSVLVEEVKSAVRETKAAVIEGKNRDTVIGMLNSLARTVENHDAVRSGETAEIDFESEEESEEY